MRAALVVVLLLATSFAAAQDARSREVSVVSYHLSPDSAAGTPRADPFSGPDSTRLTGVSPRLPLTRIDGVVTASDAPEGDPASAAAHFQELRRLVQERQRQGATIVVGLAVSREGPSLVIQPTLGGDHPEGITLRVVVVEDGLAFEGGSGIGVHRFVARHVEDVAVDILVTRVDVSRWDATKLSVVAAAIGPGGEALNSATWLARDGDRPIESVERAVLIEHVTATWCEPCAPSDAALDLLASQMGLGFAEAEGERAYWRAPSTLAFVGLGLGAAVGVALVVRGRRA